MTYVGEVPYLDRQSRFVEATYLPQLDENKRVAGLVALISDVSERKAFERFRAAAALRAERLVKITTAVADAVTTDEVLGAVVDNVAAALMRPPPRCGWSKRTAGPSSSRGQWATRNRPAKVQSACRSTPRRSIPAIDAIRRGEPVWIPSQEALLRDYPHLGPAITPGRSYRISCLPLVSHGRTLGALGITIDEPREAMDDERDFLLLVARYAGQAIERLRLLEAERKSRSDADAAASRLAVLNQASRAFGDADLDLEARLRGVASES